MSFLASLDKRRWGTALVTLVLAFFCGYVMQNILADQPPVAIINDGPDAAPLMRQGDEPKPLPVPPAATLVPILERPPVLPDRVDEDQARAGDDPGCSPVLTVEAAPAATLRVTLAAPCHTDTRVSLQQGDMAVTAETDAKGDINLRIPALSSNPVINVAIAGKRLTATTEIPDATEFLHVAIQWTGQQALRINAYEFGAQKSQFGHVWSGAPKSPSRASRGSGGFLTKLGDEHGRSAEIYSFPVGQAAARGVVRLVVEAEVTKENCGKRVQATAFQTSPLGKLSPTDVSLTMPGCDQVGKILRLQNLLQDMRLAAR